MNYKYCIKERMDSLPVKRYNKVKNDIIIAIGKTRRTFDRYCNFVDGEHGDVPAQDLDIIASFLDCTADDLKNYTITKTEIIRTLPKRNRKVTEEQEPQTN